MGESKRRHTTEEKQREQFEKDVKRRREEALPIDNFLIDGDTGMVYFSASKTQAGIALVKETTLCTPLHGFAEMAANFLRLTFNPGAAPNGNIKS